MRITFVIPGLNLTGGARVVALYTKGLRARGHEVNVVAPLRRAPSLRRRVQTLLKNRRWIRHEPRPQSHLALMGEPYTLLDHCAPVTAADVPDADVVIATWWLTAEWVLDFPESKGRRCFLVQDHEVFPNQPVERVRATWKAPLHKIAVSKYLVDIAASEYGDHNVSLVPNSVDTTQFHAPPRQKRPVTTVGMLYARGRKAGEVGVSALNRAAALVPELKVSAFGRRPLPKELQLPENSTYRVSPPQHELKDIYAACDAWLWPTRHEGFGLPILEAMACRTPVIGTRAGAAPELLADGRGIFVDCDDVEGMAEAIVRIHEMPEAEWQAMADNAYNHAHSYTWDDATDLFEQALLSSLR